MIMAQTTVYLHFNGACREAMTFYQRCLGGELTLQTIGESPIAGRMPVEMHGNIMHSTLIGDGVMLLASDMMRAEPVTGNTMSLMLMCGSDKEIHDIFACLAEGGTVNEPLKRQFWGDTYGELTDRFGMHWLLNHTKAQVYRLPGWPHVPKHQDTLQLRAAGDRRRDSGGRFAVRA
jgi:PhnB protein